MGRDGHEWRTSAGSSLLTQSGPFWGLAKNLLSFGWPDEAEIKTEQEENEMDDGTATADLGCFDKNCPQKRHRNIGEIEIEQGTR